MSRYQDAQAKKYISENIARIKRLKAFHKKGIQLIPNHFIFFEAEEYLWDY